MTNMRILIRIVLVIFIANGIDCLGGVCDDCCDCFKEKDENEEIAISLVANLWYNAKIVLKIFEKEENSNVFTSKDNKYKISIKSDEKNNPKIAYQKETENEPKLKDKLKLEGGKYAFFEIKTKEKKTVYLYCSDVESSGNKDRSRMGIFLGKDHISISVIACDTEKVTDMNSMFFMCSSLTKLDLKNFNTSNVRNMRCMFYECSSLKKLDLQNFNTTNVTDMGYMFSGCKKLTELNIENFDTTKVEDMMGMFSNCSMLENLNLNNFNTTNVWNMKEMFSGCSNLENLDINNFNTTNVWNMESMFVGCKLSNKIKNEILGKNK